MNEMYQRAIAKLNDNQRDFVLRVAAEADHYTRNPRAGMQPGYMNRFDRRYELESRAFGLLSTEDFLED